MIFVHHQLGLIIVLSFLATILHLLVVAKIFDYGCIFTILPRYEMENMLSKWKTILSPVGEFSSIL